MFKIVASGEFESVHIKMQKIVYLKYCVFLSAINYVLKMHGLHQNCILFVFYL